MVRREFRVMNTKCRVIPVSLLWRHGRIRAQTYEGNWCRIRLLYDGR